MLRYKKALTYFKRHKFSPDEKRNFCLGGVVSANGISFAVEKYSLDVSSENWGHLRSDTQARALPQSVVSVHGKRVVLSLRPNARPPTSISLAPPCAPR